MTIDKPMEPKIPDPPLGVSREILGDPCGGDGGGGGQRMLRDWSEGRTRRSLERRQMGAWKEEQRSQSRSIAERRQMRAWKEERVESRRNQERRKMRDESRRNVVWRSNNDGTWRRVVMEDDREVQILSEKVLMPPAESAVSYRI